MTHQATLEQWHGALAKALRDRAIDAIPGILVRMARDGWGHEAEEARRMMSAGAARQEPATLGELLGHNRAAAERVQILTAVYRRHGIGGLRDAVDGYLQLSTAEQDVALLTELVLQVAERLQDQQRAQAQAAFDRAEAADEAAAVRRGGGR